MQDPFFQLTHENPISLDSFFNTDLGLNEQHSPASQQMGADGIPADSAEMKPDQAQAIQEVQKNNEDVIPLSSASSIEDRIKAVEREYNEKMISIVGQQVHKRLVTLASKLAVQKMHVHASGICDILQDS